MLYFVYELVDPKTDIPGYVGISNNPNTRHKQHIAITDNNGKKKAWVQKILDKGLEPKMNILEVVEGEPKAREREKYWIQHYTSRGLVLTNIKEMSGEYVTIQEATRILHRSEKQVRRYVKTGRLDAELIDGQYQIYRSGVDHMAKHPERINTDMATKRIEALEKRIEQLEEYLDRLTTPQIE